MLTSRRPWPGAPTGARPPSLLEPLVPEAAAARVSHSDLANALRALAMDAVEQAKSGHPGLPMGAADVATVLFTKFLKYDAADPRWPDRDRFVLSAGHGSMLLYGLLHLTGVEGVTIDELRRFRQLESKTPGHPECFMTPGVETTTGPLGQGLGAAVGMALAERMLAAEFGPEAVDHYTYVLASDGDLMEGLSQEAIALAGHLRLAKLIVLFDDNGISIDGPLSLSNSTDQVKRVEASGWRGLRVDGHDPAALARAIRRAQRSDRPTLIACRTTIGYGAPKKAGTSKAHGEPLGRRGACRRQGGARLERRRLRCPGGDPQGLGAGGPARPARAQGLAEAARGACPRSPRRVRAAHQGRGAVRARRGDRRAQGVGSSPSRRRSRPARRARSRSRS